MGYDEDECAQCFATGGGNVDGKHHPVCMHCIASILEYRSSIASEILSKPLYLFEATCILCNVWKNACKEITICRGCKSINEKTSSDDVENDDSEDDE